MLLCGCGHEDAAGREPENSGVENPGGNDNNDEGENGKENNVNPFNFETRTVLLNSGYEMPIFGIGTFRLSEAQAEESVYNALKIGVRLFDTADIYGNERGVGRGIRRGMQDFGIRREEIFVTTKLWTSDFYRADEEVDERLERLGLDYIDLLLLHHAARDDEHAYQAMERGVAAGKIRSIGISNFYEADIDRLMRVATIKPAVIQNELHPYYQERSVKEHIAPLGTVMESWFPLGGRGTGIRTLSQHEVITGIASAHNKSPYQVLIRWHLQSGNIAIPGSSNAAHIAEDYDVFDFELSADEMKRINDLDCNHRFANY
ncbi:aldo/keto reductase [Bacteroides uniformis]|uniref:Aldo/keto reductase n=2 Tax=Bacteroides uniformis TaxID=820 RepID=A0A6I0LRS5_BACUN|nr:aldo/keto reductase [Bacteroides uniformis]KAB4254150.1 aldo/keto reductase [Bacteroides uniformis]KAB4257717.1 aldo/keto reductase [Bacteroides uniformis]KAB4260205.1 aldo/keto reductase [Bacteroides uniformis]